MVVDEFGREIPNPGGDSGGGQQRFEQAPSHHHRHHDHHRHHSFGGRPPPQRSFQPRGGRKSKSPRHSSRHSNASVEDRHVSFRYASEPLLCQFVWNDRREKKDDSKTSEKDQESPDHQQQENENVTTSNPEEERDSTNDRHEDGASEEKKEQQNVEYTEYRRQYCLNYIRAFFNQHLDDTWFRHQYSPAGRMVFLEREHEHRVHESKALLDQIMKTKIRDDPSGTHPFIEQARLGGGQKSTLPTSAPASHLFSWQQSDSDTAALLLSDISPAVTDDQLVVALLQQCPAEMNTKETERSIRIHGMLLASAGRGGSLQREALLLAPRKVVEGIAALGLQSVDANSSSNIPRRNDTTTSSSSWMIHVDCTDPYGRLEYDANGKGAAPADGSSVPPQKSRVWVSRVTSATPTAVLTAAMSTSQRIPQDMASAHAMATSLDSARQIPSDSNWQAVCQALALDPAAGDTSLENLADTLDVCIAYLRRIHLVSFYHSAEQPATGLAQVMTKQHAVSLVRLRLEQADTVLSSTATVEAPAESTGEDTSNKDENDDSKPVVLDDMLVQQLNNSLQQAQTDFTTWADRNHLGQTPVEATHALEISNAVRGVEDQWLQDHTLVDDDHRARCSFHFCHKLFKDTTFLRKHLLKKHSEYLMAEQAKCHDSYMMKAWDAADQRPVPDILVDCGSRFGLVAATVSGQVPDCVDPEPDLWKREEERRQEVMRRRREESRLQQQQQQQQASARMAANFVDVDDMKVEKVELSFENVDVPVVTKKKKKKRKLL